MSVTDGIGQTPCSLEHYLVVYKMVVLHVHTVVVFCLYPYCMIILFVDNFFYLGGQSVSCKAYLAALRFFWFCCVCIGKEIWWWWLTATHHSHGSPKLCDFFPAHLWRSDPQPIFTRNGSNYVHPRKGVPFAGKSLLFMPLIPKRSKFCNFLDWENFRSIWPLAL